MCLLWWFQFQYGAIWRIISVAEAVKFKLVSIPVWCDLEQNRRHKINVPITRFNSSMVRFGVWLHQICRCDRKVSIPVWCDLESVNPLSSIPVIACFNSSMVRFGVIRKNEVLLISLAFQFQYGAIWRFP